jgi:hypothetical protein
VIIIYLCGDFFNFKAEDICKCSVCRLAQPRERIETVLQNCTITYICAINLPLFDILLKKTLIFAGFFLRQK